MGPPGPCIARQLTDPDNEGETGAAGPQSETNRMPDATLPSPDYTAWLAGLKTRVEQARQCAVLSVTGNS